MSRIVIDAREYATSTGRYISRLVQYLDAIDTENQTGHEYLVLLKPGDMDAFEPSSPRFSKVACQYKEFTFDEQLGLLGQIKDLKPDLVHFGMVQQPIGYRGLTVTTMHDLTTLRFRNPSKNPVVFWAKQQIYRGVNQYAARKSAFVITPTQFVKDDVVRFTHIPEDKVVVTLESADPIPDTPELVPSLDGKRFIMYVGRPLPHKNLGRLIDAFAQLKVKHPDLVLVLAGKVDSVYEKHHASVVQKTIPDVHFTGFVSEGQLRWLYEHCAAYVFPSLSEGFGLPGLEAMVHGAPVVSSNATCLPEVYGPAAHYFDPLDVPAIAGAINDVLTDDILAKKMIEKGRAQAALYSWRKMAEQTLTVYNRALEIKE